MAHDGSFGSAFTNASGDSRPQAIFDPTFSDQVRERARDMVSEHEVKGIAATGRAPRLFEDPLFTLTVSSFLKWSLLNQTELKYEIRERLRIEKRRAYDRYGNLRRYVTRAMRDMATHKALIEEAKKIKNEYERRDTISALDRLFQWIPKLGSWEWFKPAKVYWVSFNGLFRVKIQPEAGIKVDGADKTLSTYNTASPAMTEDAAVIGCTLVRSAYARSGRTIALENSILSLQTPTAFESPESAPTDGTVGFEGLKRIAYRVELAILEVLEETD